MLSLLLALGIYGRVLLNSQLQVETLPTEVKAEVGALIAQSTEALLSSLLVEYHRTQRL